MWSQLSRTIRRVNGALDHGEPMTTAEMQQARTVLIDACRAKPRRLVRAFWLGRLEAELHARDPRFLFEER